MSQTTKQFGWLEQTAKEADLMIDDHMFAEIEGDIAGKGKKKVESTKGSVERDRMRLKALLNEPWEVSVAAASKGPASRGGGGRRERQFVVVAK
jgi:hypothetical protein